MQPIATAWEFLYYLRSNLTSPLQKLYILAFSDLI